MRTIFLILLSLSSIRALANDGDVEQIKKAAIDNWTNRIAELEKAKACVAAATTKEGVQSCKAQLKAEMVERKEQKIDEKINKLREKKNQIKEH